MIPQLAELLAAARVVALPLAAPFRGITERELVLIEGPSGWAEFAPFRNHDDSHSALWLQAALEQAFGEWPALVRNSVPVNAIIPDVPAAEIGGWVQSATTAGISSFKLKVGSADLAADLGRVTALRAAAPSARIRVDANAQWSVDAAITGLREITAAVGELEYVEQPCATLAECAEVRRVSGCRVAVDEAVRLARNPMQLRAELVSAADLLVLKAIPLGGVQRALRLAADIGLPVVVSGSLDSEIGLAAGLRLAGCLPQLDFACGLATGALFAADLVANPQRPQAGSLQVQRSVPNPDLLSAAADRVATAQRNYWQDRITRCYELLEAA